MGFLRRLFGGAGRESDKDALYLYVRSRQTGEVIRVRIHRYNDLSMNESGDGYFVRKVIVGEKSFDRMEAHLDFDTKRQLVNSEVIGGELVDAEAYRAYQAGRQASSGT